MEYNDEIINIIQRMSAAAYEPAQIAHAIGVNKNEFIEQLNTENSKVNTAFYKGYYSSQLAIRESLFKLARDGSSPAQTQALKLFDDTRKKLKFYE